MQLCSIDAYKNHCWCSCDIFLTNALLTDDDNLILCYFITATTRIALTRGCTDYVLTHDLGFQSQACYGHDSGRVGTNRQMDRPNCITFLANTVSKWFAHTLLSRVLTVVEMLHTSQCWKCGVWICSVLGSYKAAVAAGQLPWQRLVVAAENTV